jgi:hypothetical protein
MDVARNLPNPILLRKGESTMEINSSSMAARESALNKAGIGQEILSRTLAKAEETDERRSPKEPKAPEPTGSSKQGRIDLSA